MATDTRETNFSSTFQTNTNKKKTEQLIEAIHLVVVLNNFWCSSAQNIHVQPNVRLVNRRSEFDLFENTFKEIFSTEGHSQ